MILLKRQEKETDTVQVYSISGETDCGVSLNLMGIVCYNLDSNTDFLGKEEVEELALKQVGMCTSLSVKSLQVSREKLLSFQFFDHHDDSSIENIVGDYLSEMEHLSSQHSAA